MLKLGQNLLLAGVYIDLRTIAQKKKRQSKDWRFADVVTSEVNYFAVTENASTRTSVCLPMSPPVAILDASVMCRRV